MTESEIMRRLVAARHHSGLTQQDVADRLHVCRAAIGKFETINASHTLATVLRYAAAVGAELRLGEFVALGGNWEPGRRHPMTGEDLAEARSKLNCAAHATSQGDVNRYLREAVALMVDALDRLAGRA